MKGESDSGSARHALPKGVTIERRRILSISLATLGGLSFNLLPSALAQQRSELSPELAWDAVVERANFLARQLVASPGQNEDLYLRKVSALIARRSADPRALFDLTQPVAHHYSLQRFPLLVLQFRLTPGATIPYHDHRDYIGVLTVTEGTLRVRSFEIVDSNARPAPRRTFFIRKTEDEVLTKGGQSTLSRTRSNIHDLRAGPEGARFIDFFTLFNLGAHSVNLDVIEQPTDADGRIYEAKWAERTIAGQPEKHIGTS